jgi:hypothetical protein
MSRRRVRGKPVIAARHSSVGFSPHLDAIIGWRDSIHGAPVHYYYVRKSGSLYHGLCGVLTDEASLLISGNDARCRTCELIRPPFEAAYIPAPKTEEAK